MNIDVLISNLTNPGVATFTRTQNFKVQSNYMLTPVQMHNQNKVKPKRYKSKKLNNQLIVQL